MENYEMLLLMVRGCKADLVQTSGPMILMDYPIGAGKSDNWITVAYDMRLPQSVTVTMVVNSNGEVVCGARFYEVTNLHRDEFDYESAIDLDNSDAESAIRHIVDYMDWYDEAEEALKKGRGV